MSNRQPKGGEQVAGPATEYCARILHLEDSANDAGLILDALEDGNLACAVTHALNRSDFETAIERERFDIILCDNHLPGYSGMAALEFAKQHQPQAPVIILSGTLDDAHAVLLLKKGATDYVLKDRLPRLVPAIHRALDEADERLIRTAAEDRIREQANLLNLARDAILVRNMDDRIVYWNAGAEALFGWSEEEALGQDFPGLLQCDPALLGLAKKSLLQSGDWIGEINLKGKGGDGITVMSRWNLVRDQDGRPQSILSINTDVTERKKLEDVLLRAQRMESVGSLAGGIVHDLNNALSPALLGAGLLESCEDTAERRKYVDAILSSVRRATGMAQQILSFTHGRGGCVGPVALNGQVCEVEKMARDTLPKSIAISVKLGGKKLWNIQGDPTELRHALLNLCVNARHAMPGGGKLTLSVQNVSLGPEQALRLDTPTGPYVMLSVTDTGHGIPPEGLRRIFEPALAGQTGQEGSGLGLSTVAHIVKRHGGRIDVQTELGKGTEFRLYFPATERAEAAETPRENAPLPTGHGELILLIEDEEAVRELTKTSLENFGYRVVAAHNGVEGIALFEQNRDKIRMVVTDTDMPEMNGLAAVCAIKGMRPDLPVIIASGSQHSPEELRRIDAERMIKLGKPYSVEQLLVGVAAALQA